MMKPKQIGIMMGSKSDEPIAQATMDFLKEMNVPFWANIASAHRTPDLIGEILTADDYKDIRIIIAFAGMAAHLPGIVAALAKPLTVIGVPIKSKYGILDSTFSMLSMPPGVVVLTVGIEAGKNAAIAACNILAQDDSELYGRLMAFRQEMAEKVRADNERARKTLSFDGV
jgi:5-(carboxyamino)imidazole ribonucleotide mutase